VRQAKGKGEGMTESDNTQHMNTTGKNIGNANIHYVIKSNDRSVFEPYLDIETTFLVQPKCRIMEKDPTDRSVITMRPKYTDAPSFWAKYGKNRKNRIFNLS
jgi:hypothetical protein